jgi:transcription elongation factor Elf1
MPPQYANGQRDLAAFNCPLCGATEAFVTCVPRPNGSTYATAFFECSGCTVMFRDVRRFMWLIKRYKDPADPGRLYYVETPQRALDATNEGGTLAGKLVEAPPVPDA